MVAARKANLKHGANQFRQEGADGTLLSRGEAAELLGVSKGNVQRRAPGPRRAHAIAEWMQPKLGVSVLTSATNQLTARHATNGVVLWHKEVPRGDRAGSYPPIRS